MRDPLDHVRRQLAEAKAPFEQAVAAVERRLVEAMRFRTGPRRPRRPRPDAEAAGVPVDPRRPSSLDGGAAAALAFDD